MSYLFVLGDLRFPVAPAKLTMAVKNRNRTATLLNGGEINLLRDPGLTEIRFEALLPQSRYPFVSGERRPPEYYLGLLARMKEARAGYPFVVGRRSPGGALLFSTSLLVTVEEYTAEENARDGRDVRVDVLLRQYREYHTLRARLTQREDGTLEKEPSAPARPAPREIPETYTVKKGDCLWNICRRELGDGSRCWRIAKLNGLTNPNLIREGQVLRLG